MFSIIGTTISLTRGDSAAFAMDIVREKANGTKEPYEMQEGDALTLTVRRSANAPNPVLVLQAQGGIFQIKPADTKMLAATEYVYDIQLETAEGDVYTVVGSDGVSIPCFRLLPEVSR